MEQYGYYDLFLMSKNQGDVYFSVTKEGAFGQRTNDINSSLRDVWRIATKQGTVALSDTKPYTMVCPHSLWQLLYEIKEKL